MKKSLLAVALGSAVMLTGAGAIQTQAVAAPSAKPKTQCFFNSQVQNFTADGDKTLYVRAGSNVYRLDMFGRCLDLDNSQNIILDSSPSSSICSAQDVTVVVHSNGMGVQRCPVRTLTKLTVQEVAALPKKHRP